jgi:peptidoglycan hydrolase-like protein with peptidoglycan-binding domain
MKQTLLKNIARTSLFVVLTGSIYLGHEQISAFEVGPQVTSVPSARMEVCTFPKNLSQGQSSSEVMCLQKYLNSFGFPVADSGLGSKGNETLFFGLKTKTAVIRWQLSQGLPATGFFGPLSRAQYAKLASEQFISVNPSPTPSPSPVSSPSPASSPAPISTPSPAPASVTPAPVITSITPLEVRSGDTVTIHGSNFAPSGNRVTLGDGPLTLRFENLISQDGKTLTFTYVPPNVKTMTESEIRALPGNAVEKIEGPIKAVGGTLADALTPYKGIHNEDELRTFLTKNGRSFDEMYHFFWVKVENSYGKGATRKAVLRGLRKFPFDTVAVHGFPLFLSDLGHDLDLLAKKIFPTANAQFGGGYTSGIVMVCTCATGELTFQIDLAGGGTNFYLFEPGFIPMAGSGLIAGPWLGGYIPSAGICLIGVDPYCAEIVGNLPMDPVGYAF